MGLYAIGDLHLSGKDNKKSMDIFGDKWSNHWQRIKENWISLIDEEDCVLIPGDISWALKLEEAKEDILEISKLPGKKIILRGNHDYWWSSYRKVQQTLVGNMQALQNNSIIVGKTAICGTRGWICPNERNFTLEDKKIYERELLRLKLSLDSLKGKEYEKIVVMLHYPPFNDKNEESGFVEIIESYNVNNVIYAHLHNIKAKSDRYDFIKNEISYNLVSCDYLDFIPQLII